ncbi:UDP-N-acetylglucosamine--N-acetylmuramyl-(pentapeptide) pyrophosphoryl-undecaprenol N-acetylglucosamine transferase [Caminibacter mediatlanticus TB-2]|uniref:UDP-N-acetylglucosamine--N-acetylmuramyl-(pentapeptide) pyrophosphoryl-undecaprenol N-acetylglucosamine transferase n=1 Tax=Caminibacter mediatlanticus TB-2 TaxID=391592 RepID=A0ABX5V6N0_9BACT|nr:UDP-N-acetylglucosamine--N-acetylmuramyl-(pentapeptide) pyrophosphoryl-undecaprenol N-acetylglucosamine transferase [Caminibacter mediatlanticus]QCT93901.1 UDP-N-acetylglucosamine--N-acetylmuramyl-(pentapeptide) pyrophosphoryl-undecaprenol N-acetylglucosamine transferase [Caminibacter mediatlanticus TB-2]
MKNEKLNNIAITGGGTGGHLKIAKVIKDELNKRGIKPIYIGSTSGADMEWFENDEGFSAKYFLDSSGVVNKKGLSKITALSNILKNSFEAKKILKKHNIKKVFSVGGYSAAPASFASLGFCKLYIHEQNAHIGSLNKILKPFSKRFFNTFFYNDPYPIEDIFFKTARIRKEIKTIIFLGGSQGALQINNLALEVAKELNKKDIKIIHQTGKKDYKRVKEFYEKEKIDANVFDFDKNLAVKIASSDLAISRAGASTLFELTANKLPAIFIPYPYAAGDHQYYNAKWLADKNAAIVKRNVEKKEFFKILNNINIEVLSKNLDKIKLQNGVEKIVDEMLRN